MISNTESIHPVGIGKKTSLNTETGEDETLAEAIKGRDETAFRRVWEKYHRWVYQIIYSILHHHEEAEEIWQDAFLKVWQKIDGFDSEKGSFPAWIATIARNAAIDQLRRRKRRPPQVLPQEEEFLRTFIDCSPTADQQLEAKELKHTLEEALDHLSNPKHRLAFLLRHQEGLSIKEIAAHMAAPEGSVKIWIFRATRELACKLQQRGFLPLNALS